MLAPKTPHLPKKLPVKTVLVIVVLLVLVLAWSQESAATAQQLVHRLQIFVTAVAGGGPR